MGELYRDTVNELYRNSANVTSRRLRDYLHAMGLPDDKVNHLLNQLEHVDGNTIQAFGQLHSLMSDQGQKCTGALAINEIDASLFFRLSSWLEPGSNPCPPWLENLFDTPSIQRCSMVPEGWDE